MLENLAIKGGGVKGIAYVGAIDELDKAGLYQQIRRVSGTSAGALMACMICAGYSVDQVHDLMKSIRFNQFKSGWNPLRIFTHYGLYSGNYIINFVHAILKNSPRKLSSRATFIDMKKAGCRDLYVFACNTTTHTVSEFSADKTPHCGVAEAIRASMSIPFFFKAYRLSTGSDSSHLYVDGGLVYNYPLSFFDDPRFNTSGMVNPDSMGLYLYSPHPEPEVNTNYSRPLFFTKHIFESLLDAQDYLVLQDPEQVHRSVLINDLNLLATNFNITITEMDNLIESGREATRKFISQRYSTAAKQPLQVQ
jgi:NTE family protein